MIVDFVLVDKPQPSTQSSHNDSKNEEESVDQPPPPKQDAPSILYSTNYSDIVLKFLQPQKIGNNVTHQKLIYQHSLNKSLINDHYISSICYLPHPVDKLFTVSQIRPDIQYQEKLDAEQKEKQGASSLRASAVEGAAVGSRRPGAQQDTHAQGHCAHPHCDHPEWNLLIGRWRQILQC